MSNPATPNSSMEKIQKIISVKFGVDLTQKQTYNLLESLSEELKRELLKEKIDPTSLDILIENISEKVTGMHYPTEFSTAYFRDYYQKKLIENRDNFFGKLFFKNTCRGTDLT